VADASSAGIPPKRLFILAGFHRLIPSKFSEQGTVFVDVANDATMLRDLVFLDGASNERILGEERGLIGISPLELVYGIPHAQIVNAAFLHPGPAGSRFNDNTRGAWYAADELETSLTEVAYHKAARLRNIIAPGLPGERPHQDISTFDDWRADFHTELHTLEPAELYTEHLQPEPVPACYAAPQALARTLLYHPANGLIYPSVRRPGHTCVVCFRPALVYSPRRDQRLQLSLLATNDGYRHEARPVALPA
jgi:RES domain-containing protein